MRFALLWLSLLTTGDKPMGLDMYAYAKKTVKPHPTDTGAIITGETITDDKGNEDFVYFDNESPVDIAYWRKFNALHGWMEQLYISKGGNQEFNCIDMQLTRDDLQKLKQACKDKTLTPTEGFFFGSQAPVTDDAYNEVLEFISDAVEAIKDGYVVYYSSWW